TEIEEIGRPDRLPLGAGGAVVLPEIDETVRVHVGERSQQHPVHHAEQGRREPDPQRQRHDHHSREAPLTHDLTDRQTNVVPERAYRPPPPFPCPGRTPEALALAMDPLHVAEVQPGLAPRLRFTPTLRHQLPGALLDVEVELVAYLAVERVGFDRRMAHRISGPPGRVGEREPKAAQASIRPVT